jgi:hypothetical protein
MAKAGGNAGFSVGFGPSFRGESETSEPQMRNCASGDSVLPTVVMDIPE